MQAVRFEKGLVCRTVLEVVLDLFVINFMKIFLSEFFLDFEKDSRTI